MKSILRPQHCVKTKHRLLRIFGVATFAPFIVLAACSGKKGENPTASGAPPAASAELLEDRYVVEDIEPGTYGGKIILALLDDPRTFNEPLASDASSSYVTGLFTGSLTDYDSYKQEEIPGMAKSWEYNKETREWTFHLRRGMKWSDGHPITSDDFLFYVEVVRHPDVASPTKDFLESDGKPFEFSTPDENTFVAKIPVEDSFAFLSLGLIRCWPRHQYGRALTEGRYSEILGTNTDPKHIPSSGPFKLKQFVSGEKIVFERNPQYYKYDTADQRLPYVDELIFLIVADMDAMELRFQNGDIDYLESIQPQSLPTIRDEQDAGGYHTLETGISLSNNHYWFNVKPGGSYTDENGDIAKWEPDELLAEASPELLDKDFQYFIDPVKQKWFTNPKFRIACSMLTNREDMVKTVLFGEGVPIYGPVNPSNEQWYNSEITRFPYDPEKAAALLEEIGMIDRDDDGVREDEDGNPVRFTIITNKENGVRERIGVLLAENMREAGLDAKLQLLDFNNIITKIDDTYAYDICLLGLASGVPPHPSMGANVWLSKGHTHNWFSAQKKASTPWEAEIDELYRSMKKTFSVEEHIQTFARMQDIWTENQPVVHLVALKHHVAVANKIGNLKPTPLRNSLTHNIEQHYVKP